MKKFLSVMLIGLLCLGLLSGCGKAAEEDAPAAEVEETADVSIPENLDIEIPETYLTEEPIIRGTALTIHGVDYPLELCQIFYAGLYYEFLEQYGSYASMYGLDISTGLFGLENQACSFSEDGTWYGYFIDGMRYRMSQAAALSEYAKENGIEFTEEEMTQMDAVMDSMELSAGSAGFENFDAYLEAFYGMGVTKELYRTYMEMMNLANKGYSYYYKTLEFTDEELDAHFLELGYEEGQMDYRLTSMRHLLIMAQPNAEGEYTEEAIQEAHDKVQALYDEWLSGDMTEESFAEMANTYSDDGGSNTNGGLYTDIFQGQMIPGIDSWLFEEEHEVGDTVIVDNNGSYTGTHIVFFAGYGELRSRLVAKDDLVQTSLAEWLEEMMKEYEPEEGIAYQSIGKGF